MLLDKFYNFIDKNETVYSDNLSTAIDLVMSEKERGRLSDSEVSLLVQLILSKEVNNEILELERHIRVFSSNSKEGKHSVFLNLSSREKKYV
ncbi:MAG: hypothetical protein Q8Q95_02160 [bacterium]|nr:hypothetical protein [bacterium]